MVLCEVKGIRNEKESCSGAVAMQGKCIEDAWWGTHLRASFLEEKRSLHHSGPESPMTRLSLSLSRHPPALHVRPNQPRISTADSLLVFNHSCYRRCTHGKFCNQVWRAIEFSNHWSTAATMKDNAYDVSDPTDWQGTPLASLTQVERSLRCHVCKDFFNSPMTTSCCHTFCSLCIRRALNTDARCPLCRATDQESRLRGNHAIREAVEAFTASRDATLQFARQVAAGIPAATPKRKADQVADQELAPKRTRMSTRSSSARASKATAAIVAEEDIPKTRESLYQEEYVPGTQFAPDMHKAKTS